MKRAAFWLSRCGFMALFAITSIYCLLAYVPFTYQQFLKAQVLAGLTLFARVHVWLYWLTIGVLAATLLGENRFSRSRTLLFSGLGVFGIALLFHPLLPNLENSDASYYWALAMLAPLLCFAVLDCSAAVQRGETNAPLLDQQRAFTAAWQSALFLSLLYTVIAAFRSREWSGATLLWSIAFHLVLFCALFVALNWIWAAATIFKQPQRVQFILLHVLGAIVIWLAFRTIVFPPITFDGPRAEIYAAALGITLSAYVAGLRVSAVRTGWTAGAWVLIPIALAGGWITLQTARMDWNFLLQKLIVGMLWLAVFAVIYRTPLRVPTGPRSVPVMLAVAIGVVIGFRAMEATPLLQTHVKALDHYAGYDVSFRLIRDILTPPTDSGDEDFYRFLSQNTNIPRSTQIAPAEVKLVDRLAASQTHQPNIFIFVIDSLRRDYLSPYNPVIKFTPGVADFARDSVVLENAFTRYGGTGLSEPSIWVGGMMIHKQYVTPFAPMNSLEKLIQKSRYQSFISRDSILSTILEQSPASSELDRSKANMNYDFCSTLQELEGRVSSASRAAGPIFAYSQPQNIHISVIQREQESVLPGGSYKGFYAPYASRLARMDACFGGFIQFLKARGLYDDSIVILTADHGDSLGEEGRWGHAYTIFPEILRIPLIIHLPPALRQRLVYDPDRVTFLTDITPSLYYLLGHRPILPNAMFGRPIFTEKPEEQKPYQRDEYMVASSYGAVYGILSANGRRLYVADAANQRDYFLDLSGGSGSLPLSDAARSGYRQQIREDILRINDFYGFKGPDYSNR